MIEIDGQVVVSPRIRSAIGRQAMLTLHAHNKDLLDRFVQSNGGRPLAELD